MNSINSIKKGLKLSKSLLVSTIIIGEPYTGKMELVKSIYPQALYVDASEYAQLKHTLHTHNEIVIYNFEKITNFSLIDFTNKRIIAIANKTNNIKEIEDHFAFIYYIPPLRERKDEVYKLSQMLSTTIKEELMLDESVKIDLTKLDLSQNFKSFKISLYKEFIKKSLTTEDLEEVLYTHFLENLEGKNGYKEYLPIYEKPLIIAGLKKFKSQLKLAEVLGLNRNTLRKKIHENDID